MTEHPVDSTQASVLPLPSVVVRTNADGSLSANGVRITDSRRWMQVTGPMEGIQVSSLRVRLELSRNPAGDPLLHIDQIEVDGHVYENMAALIARGTQWADRLAQLVQNEIDRRIALATKPTVSLRAVRPPDTRTTENDNRSKP